MAATSPAASPSRAGSVIAQDEAVPPPPAHPIASQEEMDVAPDISVKGGDGGDPDPDPGKESVASDHSDGLGTTAPVAGRGPGKMSLSIIGANCDNVIRKGGILAALSKMGCGRFNDVSLSDTRIFGTVRTQGKLDSFWTSWKEPPAEDDSCTVDVFKQKNGPYCHTKFDERRFNGSQHGDS